jgi:hypothetical protein
MSPDGPVIAANSSHPYSHENNDLRQLKPMHNHDIRSHPPYKDSPER